MPLGKEHPLYASSLANNTKHQCSQDWRTVPPGATSGTCAAGAGLIGTNTPTNGSKRPPARNCGYARLLIPVSLVDAISTTERHKLRTEVALFQFRMIQAVQTLRWKFADPTPHQPPSPLWLTKYVGQALPPRETPQNLRNHVGVPMRSGTKRKRRTEVATAEPIDPDQWFRDSHAANDDEAAAWLARMRATNTAQDEPTQKRRRLSVVA